MIQDFFSNIDFQHLILLILQALPIFTIMVVIILSSAILSSIETALFVITEAKVLKLSKQNKKQSKYLLKIKKNITRSISSIIFSNNFIHIMGTTLLTQKTIEIFGSEATPVVSIILTIFVILYAKIIPKVLGDKYHETISLMSAFFVYSVTILLTPISFIIDWQVSFFSKGKANVKFDEDELRYQLKIANDNGDISKSKIDHLESIFNLTNKTVVDIMTPSTQLEYLYEKDDMYDDNIKKFFQSSAHSRIIIVAKDLNRVRGYVLKDHYLSNLVNYPTARENENNKVSSITKPVLIINETYSVNDLLKELQTQKQMIAIVQNKFGTTLGVVTMEDIVEQIIGEIIDETDKYSNLRNRGEERFKSYLDKHQDDFLLPNQKDKQNISKKNS